MPNFVPRTGEQDPQAKFEYASRKLAYWMDRATTHPSMTAEKKVGKWTGRVAYQVFAMHPELREDGSFLRYFVARAGRRQGLRGTMLTAFVDKAFRDGIPADYFPAWFIAASTDTTQGACAAQGRDTEARRA